MTRHFLFLQRVAVLTSILLCAPRTGATDYSARLLASYELRETDELKALVGENPYNRDRSVTAEWVLGGLDGVPLATEGDYVLKLTWDSESDRKIEVRHEWNSLRFSLKGVDFIHVDVFVASADALPKVMGIWDRDFRPFQWVDAACEPQNAGEWRTISIGVSALSHTGLDDIEALVFEKFSGKSGTIYLDNLRLGDNACFCSRSIHFAGYIWRVLQSDWCIGAGPNRFTDSPDDVYVDSHGHLHLSYAFRQGGWYCSEVIAERNLGYGTYVFTVNARPSPMDPNAVLGLFLYDVPGEHGDPREIDVELSRWWDPDNSENAVYTVQPWQTPGNNHYFALEERRTTTHEITWTPGRVDFASYYGGYPLTDSAELIQSWVYIGRDVPIPGSENPRINFWLLPPKGLPAGQVDGGAPINEQDDEVVLRDFLFIPWSGEPSL